MIDEDFIGGEMDRMQEGWDAAKDEIDGLRARVAELETELGPTKEAADRWLKSYKEVLAERDRLKARAASQHLELGQLYPRISELTRERDEANARLNGSRQFIADEDERWRARVAQTEAVVQATKAWRVLFARQATNEEWCAVVDPLVAAVDALDGPSGAASNPGDGKAAEIRAAANRVRNFLANHERVNSGDRELIYTVHSIPDGEPGILLVSDLKLLIGATQPAAVVAAGRAADEGEAA